MSNSGDLSTMAQDGTKVPEDAAKPNVIPSKDTGADSDAIQDEAADSIQTATGDVLPDSAGDKPSGNGGKEDNYTPAPKGGRNH